MVEEVGSPEDAGSAGDPETETAKVEEEAPESPLSATKRYQEQRRQARTARWEKDRHLHEVGVNISQIAGEVGITRKTVRSLLAGSSPPRNRVARPRPEGFSSPSLTAYAGYLQNRWQRGCTVASRLFREIEAKGYEGSRTLLTQALRSWRWPQRPKLPEEKRERLRRLTRRSAMRWICL